jgi:hypothetical protein
MAINTYKQEHGLRPLVVCSRLTEYLLFPPRILLQRAIVVQPLKIEQVETFFKKAAQISPPSINYCVETSVYMD